MSAASRDFWREAGGDLGIAGARARRCGDRTGAPDLMLADRAALAWQDRALCAETDPDLFFPERGDNVAPAREVCRACAVRADCLRYALEHGEHEGVWGGLTERELRAERVRGAARPVADIIAETDAGVTARRERAAAKLARRLAAERQARALKAGNTKEAAA